VQVVDVALGEEPPGWGFGDVRDDLAQPDAKLGVPLRSRRIQRKLGLDDEPVQLVPQTGAVNPGWPCE
jgi:hypothetical protein